MNLIGYIIVATTFFMSFSAVAQSLPEMRSSTLPRTATALNKAQPTRVSVNFRMPLDAASGNDEVTATETARKALYDQALKECSLIVEHVSDAECRLENIQIMIQMQNNGMRQFQYLNANANYILTMK